MLSRLITRCFVVCVLSSASPLVLAQGSTVEDSDARTIFNLGQEAFDQGRFEAALDYFQQAYDLSHRPQLLFNIGQAADRLRQDRRALEAFEGFLAQVPDSSHHASTRARVAVLRATVESTAARDAAESTREDATPETAPITTVAEPEPSGGHGGRTLGWALVGGGGAALAVGVTFLALGVRDTRAVEDAAPGTDFASVEDAYDRAAARKSVGSVLLGVGAAAAATGVVIALVSGSSDEEPTALELRVLPNGVALGGRF